MRREQAEQFLAGEAGRAGHSHACRRGRGAARAGRKGTQDRMHEKEYLYTQTRFDSTKIDEYR
jgi:hypothetical protein